MWPAILAGAAGCYALKLAGLSLPQRVLDHPVMQRLASLLPVALLAALAALQTVTTDDRLVIDARLAGVAVAGVAIWRKAPFLVVVGLAAATTAILRQLA